MSLSVQWGNAGNSGGSVDVTFPISFTKTVYQIQLTYNSSSYENPTYAIKDTRSFSYWSKYGGDKLWLAIGKQQWGSSNVTHRDTTVTFPIAFSVLYSVVGVPKSSSNLSGSNSNFGVKSQNNTSFIANMYDNGNGYAGFNWCAFGKA